jgi:hypothetical protein
MRLSLVVSGFGYGMAFWQNVVAENYPGLKDRKTVMELNFEFGKTII